MHDYSPSFPHTLGSIRPSALNTAISGLLLLGLASGSAVANHTKPLEKNMEKCFSIAKAGKNDCAGNKSAHACANHAAQSGDPLDWVVVPKGTCSKIAGGSLKAAKNRKAGAKL